ncbi:MAG: gliding motility-associated C-terminal domain-containing protein, partial [Bacteroidetes bacterium]
NGYQILGTSVTPTGGNYGTSTTFSTPIGTAGAGDLNITISDNDDGNCALSEIIADPGDCVDCQPFTVNITAPSAICAGETADLTFTSTGGTAPIMVQYFNGLTNDNIAIGASGMASVTVAPNGMTTYVVTSISDADGCPGTTGSDATISVFPEAVGAFSDSFCEGESYTLPDGSTVTTPDIYEVVLQNQSAAGCDSIITVNLSQNPSFTISENVVICDSDVYVWNGQTYNSTGVYTLNLQTVEGCDSILTLNLTFDGIAQFGEANAGTDADECTTETELFGQDVEGTTGSWTSPTGATIEPNDQGAAFATGLQSGQNIFVWTLSTDNCPAFDSDSVTVYVLDAIPVLGDDVVTFQNTSDIEIQVLENDNLNGINQYLVTCADLPSEITNCEFDAGNETLNLQVQSNTTGDFEFFYSICSETCPDLCDSAKVFLELLGAPTTQINYIITPENQDGLNDVLFIKDLNQFPNNSLIIYNRWGSVVFEAAPYDNSWDGTRNGKRLPEADYYYV